VPGHQLRQAPALEESAKISGECGNLRERDAAAFWDRWGGNSRAQGEGRSLTYRQGLPARIEIADVLQEGGFGQQPAHYALLAQRDFPRPLQAHQGLELIR